MTEKKFLDYWIEEMVLYSEKKDDHLPKKQMIKKPTPSQPESFRNSENVFFSKSNNMKFTIRYFDKVNSLENFRAFTNIAKRFFIFTKKLAGHYPDIKEITFSETKNIVKKLEAQAMNYGGDFIKIESFEKSKIDWWTIFHELIHTYNINTKAGFVAEGLADFISYLFIKQEGLPFKKKGGYKENKKMFMNQKKDYALYDKMKKDYNPKVDLVKTKTTYAKAFFFWQMLYDTFGIDIIKQSFKMSIKNKNFNASTMKNIIKKFIDKKEMKNTTAKDFLSGWIVSGQYKKEPTYYENQII